MAARATSQPKHRGDAPTRDDGSGEGGDARNRGRNPRR
jgi:hypothetical protein